MSKITDMIKITKAGFSKDEKSNLSMSDDDLVTLLNAGYSKDEIIKFDEPDDESDEPDDEPDEPDDEPDEPDDESDESDDKNGIVEKLADKKAKKMFEKYKDDFHKKNQRKGADNNNGLEDESKIDDSFKDMIINTLK
jgi:hypothetical protein